MQLNDFEYELPENLIAQEPAEQRESSRMLAVDRASGRFRDDAFANFPERLRTGDLLVLNNTKVFPARLFGMSETGARVEIFLVDQISDSRWVALARPARRLNPGKKLDFGPELNGSVAEVRPDGRVVVEFYFNGDFQDILGRAGRTPLPPYIKRDSAAMDTDRPRYQTVYAKSSGAIAAPTAGLHFTEDVLGRIRADGVEIVEVTLHVGYGTFEPVRAEVLSKHSVLPERYAISDASADALNRARSDARRIVAVGTTTTRTLESVLTKHDSFVSGGDLAELTITPGYRFKAVGAMLTNFHLPRSSLLILVSTFGGHELIMDSYRHAVSSGYRFYSYGDCMFIE